MTTILRQWEVDGVLCKLWQESASHFRGCVFDNRVPVLCAESLVEDGQDRAQLAVEALASLVAPKRGLWHMNDATPFTDVALMLRPDTDVPEDQRLQRPMEIVEDVEVVPADWEVFRDITAACDPPGQMRGLRGDLRAPLYAFVRTNAPRDKKHHWDSDNRLQMCLALSRLVRPTSVGTKFAVRIIGDYRTQQYEMIPGPVRGFGAQAWIADPQRDWLSVADLEKLREVATAFFANPFEQRSRLQRALWFFEYAARTELVDVRWLFISTAIEALLNTDNNQSSRQFKNRIPLLASALGLSVSLKEADGMWSLRSRIAHGSKKSALTSADIALYTRIEAVLRATLERAVVNQPFASQFANEGSIDEAFPVEAKPPRAIKCSHCGGLNTV